MVKSEGISSDVHGSRFHFANWELLLTRIMLFSIYIWTLISIVNCSVACGIDRAPQFAPIPSSAKSIDIGPGGYGIESYGKGAYMVTEGNYQGSHLIHRRKEPLWSCSSNILRLYQGGNCCWLPSHHWPSASLGHWKCYVNSNHTRCLQPCPRGSYRRSFSLR